MTVKTTHVVAAVILNSDGHYLLSSRPAGKPYAGYWEFAGGKVEAGESEFAALQRELKEELDIDILDARLWLTKTHVYEHATVRLRFFRIDAHQWQGTPRAKEQQQWSWQRPGDYTVSPMLPANTALLAALAIPTTLTGSPEHGFVGQNACGEYRITPYTHEADTSTKLLLTQAQAAELPHTAVQSHWLWVGNTAEFRQSQHAHALIWRIDSEEQARELLAALQQGVSLPVCAYAASPLAAAYQHDWLANGLHALIAQAG